jgi:hypothetical protein
LSRTTRGGGAGDYAAALGSTPDDPSNLSALQAVLRLYKAISSAGGFFLQHL